MPFTPIEGKCTGFEQGSTEIIPAVKRSAQTTVVATSPHTGAYHLRVYGYASYGRFDVDGTPSQLNVGVWVRMPYIAPAFLTRNQIIYVYLTDGNTVSLRYDSTNSTWDAYVGAVKVADGTVVIDPQNHHNIQIDITIADAGSISTKIDGIADITYSGDTKPGAVTAIATVGFEQNNDQTYFDVDDLSIGTNGWSGDIRYDGIFPNADTATEEWTLSAGADTWDLINEVPPSDADYIYSELTGDQSIVELTDWDDTGKVPLFVTTWYRALKDEAAAHQIKLIDSNGVNTNIGPAKDLLTSASYIAALLTTAPDGTVWDNADVDSLQVGVESVIV